MFVFEIPDFTIIKLLLGVGKMVEPGRNCYKIQKCKRTLVVELMKMLFP